MKYNVTTKEFTAQVTSTLARYFGVKPEDATKNQIYRATCMVVRDILTQTRVNFKKRCHDQNVKQIYYMSMEFLLGRSLKNHLYNMGIVKEVTKAVESFGVSMEEIYAFEPDAGLGNGGLGRLAAAYMDALTSRGYAASGFSILYDYGIFKQVIVDGWQLEQPDTWIKNGGDVWLAPRLEEVYQVKFGGVVDQTWQDGKLTVNQRDCTIVNAVPFDMNISGYDTQAVNRIRLWHSEAPQDFDMSMSFKELKQPGEYVITLTGRDNFSGSLDIKATVREGVDVRNLKVGKIADQQYNGGMAVMPLVNITYKGKAVTRGIDITYEDNFDTGKGYVVISGNGEVFNGNTYFAGSVKLPFNIVGKDISEARISVKDAVYTGRSVIPEIKVKMGDHTLEEGEDYVAGFKYNRNVGEAYYYLRGRGRYSGKVTGHFEIMQCSGLYRKLQRGYTCRQAL